MCVLSCAPRCDAQSHREANWADVEWACYVMTEQQSQRGIKMFQTNITPRALFGSARQQCTLCLPLAFAQPPPPQKKQGRAGRAGGQAVGDAGGKTEGVSCSLRVRLRVLTAVLPVCHCLEGLWFSSPLSSVSPGSSSTPALLLLYRHRGWVGAAGFLSNHSADKAVFFQVCFSNSLSKSLGNFVSQERP